MDPSLSNSVQPPTTIIMSTDPVSIEMQAVKMIRLNKSPAGKYGMSDMPTYLQAAAGITSALSDKTYNIGILDETKMDIRRIINDTADIGEHPRHFASSTRISLVVSPVKGSRSTFIEFMLPSDQIGHDVQIEIFDIKGRSLYRRSLKTIGAMNHFSWNNRDEHGNLVTRGVYAAYLTAGSTRIAAHFWTP
jgi:hypothetical protein